MLVAAVTPAAPWPAGLLVCFPARPLCMAALVPSTRPPPGLLALLRRSCGPELVFGPQA